MTSSQVAPKPNPRNTQKSRQGIKTLLASLSLATTLGGWAILANERDSVNQATSVATPPQRPTQAVIVLDLPPLPTLVPSSSTLATELTEQSVPTQPAPQPTLRVVNQPPPQRIVIVGGGGGGDSSNSGPQPAAQTRSSR